MEANTVTFSVYDPNGIRVTFALPLNEIAAVNGVIADVLANGFTATVAGAAPGENVEEVGFVSRREKADGTPVIDLFSPNDLLAHRVFAHYLDTLEQIADFETATGLKLSEIPVWIAEQPIKKTSPTWKQYGVQTRKVARIALKDNPRHDPNETDVTKKKPKHLFSQWLPSTPPPTENRYPAILNRDGKPTGAQPQPSANPTPPPSPSASTAGTATGSAESGEPPKAPAVRTPQVIEIGNDLDAHLDEVLKALTGTQWRTVDSIQQLKSKQEGVYYRLKSDIGGIVAFSTTALTALGIDWQQCEIVNKFYTLQSTVNVPYFEKTIEDDNGKKFVVLELDIETAKAQLEESA